MVSVIVPVYNAEKFVGECIESIVKQGVNTEIIAVDDGSEDGSGEVVKKCSQMYDNVHYFYKKNSGVSETRNYGLEKASGEYVMFVDADDMLPENAISTLKNAIEKNNADAAFGNHSYMYPDRNIERAARLPEGKYSVESLKGIIVDDGTMTGILLGSVCGAIYRRSIIDKGNLRFYGDIRRNEDGIFNIEYVMRSNEIYVVTKPSVYLYRQWKEPKKTRLEIDGGIRDATEKIARIVDGWMSKEESELQIKRRNISATFWDSLKTAGKDVKFKEARKYLKRLFEDERIAEAFESLDYDRMNGYKKVMAYLMRKKRYLLYFTAIHYVYPALENKVKR